MNFRKASGISICLGIVLALAMTVSVAFADSFDQSTRLTFDQPVAIPGQVLNPGSYWFVLASHGNTPNVMQVFDGDRKNVLATFNVGSIQLAKESGYITLTLADRSPRLPVALLDLTYPGTTGGRSFQLLYPEEERRPLSEFSKIRMKVDDKGIVAKMENNR